MICQVRAQHSVVLLCFLLWFRYICSKGVTISILNQNRPKLIHNLEFRSKKWNRRCCHPPCHVRSACQAEKIMLKCCESTSSNWASYRLKPATHRRRSAAQFPRVKHPLAPIRSIAQLALQRINRKSPFSHPQWGPYLALSAIDFLRKVEACSGANDTLCYYYYRCKHYANVIAQLTEKYLV